MGFHEKWTTILNHMNGLSSLSFSSLPSLFMHELAIRSCFSGEGRFDAVGKCVSVRLKRGRRKEGGDISKVICMYYIKEPMPQFCSEEDSQQYCEFVTHRHRHRHAGHAGSWNSEGGDSRGSVCLDMSAYFVCACFSRTSGKLPFLLSYPTFGQK